MSDNEQANQTESKIRGLGGMKWKRKSSSPEAENVNPNNQNDRSYDKPTGPGSISSEHPADNKLETNLESNDSFRGEWENDLKSESGMSENNKNYGSRKEKKGTSTGPERSRLVLSNDDKNEFSYKPQSKTDSNYSNRNDRYRDESNHYRHSGKENKWECWNERGEILPKPFFKNIPLGSKYHREFYLSRREFEKKKLIMEKLKHPFTSVEKPLNSARSFDLQVFDFRLVDKMKLNEINKQSVKNEDAQNSKPKTMMTPSTGTECQSDAFNQEFSRLNINATPFCPSMNSCDDRDSVCGSPLQPCTTIPGTSRQSRNVTAAANQELPSMKPRKGYVLNRGSRRAQTDPRINEDLIQTLNQLDAQRLKNVNHAGVIEESVAVKPTAASAPANILNNASQAFHNDAMMSVVLTLPASKLANLREFVPEATSFILNTQTVGVASAIINPSVEVVPQGYVLSSTEEIVNERRSEPVEVSNMPLAATVTQVPATTMVTVNQPCESTEILPPEYNVNVPPLLVPPTMHRNPYQATKPLIHTHPEYSHQVTYTSVSSVNGGGSNSLTTSFQNRPIASNANHVVGRSVTPDSNTSLLAPSYVNQPMMPYTSYAGRVSLDNDTVSQPFQNQPAVPHTNYENRSCGDNNAISQPFQNPSVATHTNYATGSCDASDSNVNSQLFQNQQIGSSTNYATITCAAPDGNMSTSFDSQSFQNQLMASLRNYAVSSSNNNLSTPLVVQSYQNQPMVPNPNYTVSNCDIPPTLIAQPFPNQSMASSMNRAVNMFREQVHPFKSNEAGQSVSF